MVTVKTILFPTDGSTCSKQALRYALSLAADWKAHLVALHVIETSVLRAARFAFAKVGERAEETVRQSADAEAQRILQEVADAAREVAVAVEVRTSTGVPFDEIVQVAKTLPADLIVIGTHGRTGLAHVLVGSVAERVVRHAPCPVLTVRPEERDLAR